MKIYFLFIFLFITFVIHGQKVDIDNVYLNISNCSLPINYIEPELRTYAVFLSGNSKFVGVDKEEQIKIFGWTKVSDESNSTLDIKVDIGYFNYGSPNSSSRVEEKKDKDGKVTGRVTHYKTTVANYSRGSMKIIGITNPLPPKVVSTKESKSDKKNKEKEQKLASNPFLQNVDLNSTSPQSSDTKEEVYSYSLDKEYVFDSGEHSTPSAAYKRYADNAGNIRNENENDFRNNYTKWINNYNNKYYGYAPVNNYVRFKKLDSKKHPEFIMFENAVAAMKEVFGKMRYNKPIDEIQNDLLPLVNYFDEVSRKYAGDDKDNIKLRAACLYNLARINQYLDHHDRVIELAGQFATFSKRDAKASEKFIEDSQELKRTLAFHKMTSRHIVSLVVDENDELGDKIESADDED
ncbi:MAG: hypothetical protein WAT79_14760 [Saprospiraceae bacterium]